MRLARRIRLGELLSTYDAQPLSYPEVGATSAQHPPSGYRRLRFQAVVGRGEAAFQRAARALLSWGMHAGAGLAVAASGPAEKGMTVLLGLGRPVCLVIPCRVVYLVDEPGRRVLATGTVAGHPLTGEEAFTVALDDREAVSMDIVSFSRPASPVVTAIGRLAPVLQARTASRYAEALGRAASS